MVKSPTGWYLLLAAAFIYSQVFLLPDIPLLAYGDQSIYLLNATRILDGQVMYRDFFQFTPPGTEWVYTILFKAFGVRAWIPQAMLVLLGTGLAWLSVLIARRLVSRAAVFLPGLLFLTLAFRSALDASHHWYAVCAAISMLAVVLDARSSARLAAAGALGGLATWFTPAHGLAAMLGLALFVVWEARWKSHSAVQLVKSEAWLGGSFAITVVALNARFISQVGFRRFLDCTVVFALKSYPSEWANTWRVYMTELPRLESWKDLGRAGPFLLVHAVVPLVYVLFAARYWGTSAACSDKPWDRLMFVNLAGLALFASVAPAPSYLRLCAVSLPAFIILVWLAYEPGKLERRIRQALWLSTIVFGLAGPISRQVHWRAYLDLPTGRTAFLDPGLYEEFRWIAERTRPSEPFFGDQLVCFALGLRNPAQVDFITATDYTRPEQVNNVVQALARERVRYVFWYRELDLPPILDADHLSPLRAYLREHYRLAATFADGDQAWERYR